MVIGIEAGAGCVFEDTWLRERETQRKRESRSTGQQSLTRKGARAREKKQKETFSVGGTT